MTYGQRSLQQRFSCHKYNAIILLLICSICLAVCRANENALFKRQNVHPELLLWMAHLGKIKPLSEI